MCQAIEEMIEDRINDVRVDSWNSGAQEANRKTAVNLSKMGLTPEMIAKAIETPQETVICWISGK